jgi:hypothetical protein
MAAGRITPGWRMRLSPGRAQVSSSSSTPSRPTDTHEREAGEAEPLGDPHHALQGANDQTLEAPPVDEHLRVIVDTRADGRLIFEVAWSHQRLADGSMGRSMDPSLKRGDYSARLGMTPSVLRNSSPRPAPNTDRKDGPVSFLRVGAADGEQLQ